MWTAIGALGLGLAAAWAGPGFAREQAAGRPTTAAVRVPQSGGEAPATSAPLRVCADPNNLPFSNAAGQGFENKLMAMVAADLGTRLEQVWWAQRRGFVREAVTAGACDVVAGVPQAFERLLVTRPYYRSSYVFASRADRHLRVRSFDDPALRSLRIGVQLVGEDGANTPPAHALARRRLAANLVGFTLYGNYLEPNPPARIVEAVAAGDVDVAVVWGPLAGYFAQRQQVPLRLTPVAEATDAGLPMSFAIGVGVATRAPHLRDAIDRVLVWRRAEVLRLLQDYGVPGAGA